MHVPKHILRKSGVVFVSVKKSDRKYLDDFVPAIIKCGFKIVATSGSARYIETLGYKVEKINNRDDASQLKGQKLFVERQSLPRLTNGDVYHVDIIGLNVMNLEENIILGRINNISNFGAGDILEITKFEDNSTILINFNKTNFPKVSINKMEIISKVSI